MREKISYLVIALLLITSIAKSQDDWRNLISQPGISFKAVQQAFKNEKKARKSEAVKEEQSFEGSDFDYYRWERYNAIRLDENGNLTNSTYRALQAELKLKTDLPDDPSSADWISLGPTQMFTFNTNGAGQGMGRVIGFAFANTNVYVGTGSGGAWVGTGSNTWQCLTNSIPDLSVSSICVDSFDQNIIYLLTGDGDAGANGSIGVLKSLDGGNSWFQTGLIFNKSQNVLGHKMIINPTRSQTLFAATSIGIFRTLNGGVSWTNVSPGSNFFDLEYKPGDTSTIYACTSNSFFVSRNNGGLWTSVSLPGLKSAISSRIAIAVSPANASDVYALAGSGGSPFYLGTWRSTNSAGSFTLRSDSTPNIFGGSDGGPFDKRSQAGYDLTLAVNPTNANEVFFGGINVWISENGGTTWSKNSEYAGLGNDNMHADQHEMIFRGSKLWVGNDGGIFYYDPGNITAKWNQQYDGLSIAQFYHLAVDPSGGSANYLGAQDNGTQRYDGDANNQLISEGDGGWIAIDFSNTNTYYYDINGVLYKTCFPDPCDKTPYTPMSTCSCGDTVWTSAFAAGQDSPDRPIAIDPANKDSIFTGFFGLYRSGDDANNFSFIPSAPSDANGLYIDLKVRSNSKWAIKNYLVTREIVPGRWGPATADLPVSELALTALETNPADPMEAWVTFGGYDSARKIYHTLDGGRVWNNITGTGLPNVPALSIVLDVSSSLKPIYLGTDVGVFYTDNNLSGTWVPFRNGMPSVLVTGLAIDYVNSLLYACTYGRGLWSSHPRQACPATLNLSGEASYGHFLHEASSSITSTENFDKGYNQNVNYVSQTIFFEPGFQVINGSNMDATVGNCAPLFATTSEMNGFYKGALPESPPQITEEPSVSVSSGFNIFPNPASSRILFSFRLKKDEFVSLQIFNSQSQLVTQILQSTQLSGHHQLGVNVQKFPRGIYLARFQTSRGSFVQKFILQ